MTLCVIASCIRSSRSMPKACLIVASLRGMRQVCITDAASAKVPAEPVNQMVSMKVASLANAGAQPVAMQ